MDEGMFGDLLRDEPRGLNPFSDSLDNLSMVRELTQLVPGASQRSVTIQPHTHALSGKKEQWTRCSKVHSLFQEDPQRPGHPLKIETKKKAGKVVHKIRCPICKNLFSYHNSWWTTASNHIMSHNIYTIEDIVSAALLTSQAERSEEPFPHPRAAESYSHQERRLWWRTANGALCQESQPQSRQRSIPSGEEIDWKMDCSRLPSIPHGADHGVQGYDEKLGSQVHRLWEEGDYRRGGELALQVLLPIFSLCSSGFFLPLHCFIFLFRHYLDWCWNLICIVIVQLIYCRFLLTCALYAFTDIQFICWGNHQIKEGQQLEGCQTFLHIDLWNSRCMKEYFTMTAHWIEIRGGELSPQWVLRQRVLGAFPVQDGSIDHQGECQSFLNMQHPYPQWWINFAPYGNDFKRFLSTFPRTWYAHLMLLIILFLACVHSDCSLR